MWTMRFRLRTGRTLLLRRSRIFSPLMPAAPCRKNWRRWRRRCTRGRRWAIVGGAKVSTKLDLLGNLLNHVDTLIIGGGMANTFLAAQGKAVGKSLCENDLVQTARDILAKANSLKREIVLPVDVVVAQTFAAHAPSRVVSVDAVGENDIHLDIGPRTVEYVISVLARTRRWCGTARSAPSRWNLSTTAPSKWRKRPPN